MKKIFNTKSFKYGSYAFAATAVVIAIIVALNAVLGLDAVRNRLRADITKNRMFSLSQPSIDLVSNLDKDVEIIILVEEKNFSTTEILEVLKQYNIKSNGKVTTRFVDVEKDPRFIERELDPEQVKGIRSGSIVVRSGKRNKVVSTEDMIEYDYSSGFPQQSGLKIEHAFSSAIQSVIADVTPVVYFVKGHGEITPEKELSDLKGTIVSNNYEVKELSLSADIPEDASVLVFASPKTDLLPAEMEKLLAFMEKGGDAVFLMDVQTKAVKFTNFDTVLERYAIKVNNDYVLEGDQNWYYSEFSIIIPQPNENDVTKNLDPDSLFVYMPNCRSVSIGQVDKGWVKPQPLFMTSEKSRSTNLETNEIRPGPFLLGALSEYESTGISKVAVIGNSHFVTNDWMENAGNNGERYIMAILNWMQDKDSAIFVETRSLASAPINLSEQGKFIAFILLAFILPIAIIGLGVFVWIRRKHL